MWLEEHHSIPEALRGLEKYIKACRAMHVTSPQGLEKRAP